MRKSIREIKEIAREYVEDNESDYAICGNCMHFSKFTKEEEKVLIPIFGSCIKDCGVCNNATGINGEPLIMNCETHLDDASTLCGDNF